MLFIYVRDSIKLDVSMNRELHRENSWQLMPYTCDGQCADGHSILFATGSFN